MNLIGEIHDYQKVSNKSVDIVSTKVAYICPEASQVGARNLGYARDQRILSPRNGETDFIFVPLWRPATPMPSAPSAASPLQYLAILARHG